MTPARRAARWVEGALSAILGLALLTAMAVVAVDVAGRYLLLSPLRGADDLAGMLMALMVFAGLPLVTARREHITVGLLTSALPGALSGALARAFAVLSAVILAVMAWRLWGMAAIFADFGDRTPMLHLPLAPLAAAMSTLAALAALAQLALAALPAAPRAPGPGGA